MKNMLKLCLITNKKTQTIDEYISFIKEAIHGGITMLQLRDKSDDSIEIAKFSKALQEILFTQKIPLIINDNVSLALEINAAGVHVGNSDMQVKTARELLGPDKIIGISIESLEDLERANKFIGNYYVAASAVFSSTTKLNCKKIWGLEGLKYIVDNSLHPVVAIGNINQNNAKEVMEQNAAGIAVISAISESSAFESALKLREIIEEKYNA